MRLWRHSFWDSILFSIAVAQFFAFTAWAYFFDQMPWWLHGALVPPAALLFYYNPIVITHNFLHTPFFQSQGLNRLFSLLNSGNLFIPQSIYKYHHLVHHRYNNDPIENETTQDPSSTWRFGKDGQQEHVIPYCALSLFRDGTQFAYAELCRQGARTMFFMELLVILITLGFWLYLSWLFVVTAFLAVFYLGWFLAHLENYYEHYHATNPGQRHANSVSYLGSIYNLFMFNEGYHQAHHIQPNRHWTARPEIHASFQNDMETAKARVAQFPPLLGFLERKAPDLSSPLEA